MFITHFIISNIVISFIGLALILFKITFKNIISPRIDYYMWFFFIFIMLFAFVPQIDIYINIPTNRDISGIYENADIIYNEISSQPYEEIQSINLSVIIIIIWLTGIFIGIFIYSAAFLKTRGIIKNALEYKTYGDIKILVSDDAKTPFSFGIIKKVVVLPCHILNIRDNNNIVYIINHEITHHKHNDITFNTILCLLNILFWFNPIIYIIFEKIRLDMEIYCDYTVLNIIGSGLKANYGKAILNLAEKNTEKLRSNFGGAYGRLKSRIEKIALYGKTFSRKFSACILFSMFIFSSLSCYTINIFGYSFNNYSLNSLNIENIDLNEYFNSYNGCFVMYDQDLDKYFVHNKDMAEKRFPPYSTYKIAIALNGYQNNIISADNNFMKWNGANYVFDEWNKNQNINSAMKNSVNWYFRNIDKSMGYNNIKSFLSKMSYGNKNIGFNKENYWLDGTLEISPAEQVNFIRDVFNTPNVDFIKNSIKISDGFYGKTGSGNNKGWFVGAYKNKYYFSVYIDGKGADGKTAYNILLNIFKKNIDN
ncbi:MAG: class D beta-lactamase [Clostridiales bacterium]|nr:class D beta-lactamase [Clostridiales bacterium]